MKASLGVALLAAGFASGLAIGPALLEFSRRIPAGVEFSRRVDGVEQVRIPTDRNFAVVRGVQNLIYLAGSTGEPDPIPQSGSESVDPERPIFPQRYTRDSAPPSWQTPATVARCGLENLPSKYWVKPIAVYQGSLIATTRIATPDHDYTSRVDITVSETDQPVVLILSNYRPVQWRVGQMAAAKLAGVVLVGFKKAELIGLPNTIPVFNATLPDAAECRLESNFYVSTDHGLDAAEAQQLAAETLSQQLFHRSALGITSEQAGNRIIVGTKWNAPEDVKPFYSDDGGDVFKRDPDLLLPMELGLEQLRANGAVRRATAAELAPWEAAQRAGRIGVWRFGGINRAYVLLRKTELPDGLRGVDFLLPEGVPMPDGWDRDSRVCIERLWRCGSRDYLLRSP